MRRAIDAEAVVILGKTDPYFYRRKDLRLLLNDKYEDLLGDEKDLLAGDDELLRPIAFHTVAMLFLQGVRDHSQEKLTEILRHSNLRVRPRPPFNNWAFPVCRHRTIDGVVTSITSVADDNR